MAEYRISVAVTDKATTYQVVVSANGIAERPVGPRWYSPRAAAAFMDRELAKHANPSPLRVESEGIPLPPARPEAATPLSLAGLVRGRQRHRQSGASFGKRRVGLPLRGPAMGTTSPSSPSPALSPESN